MALLGIDLGTTNSLVSYFDGQSQLIKNSLDHLMTPSAVSIDAEGNLIVGEAARRRKLIDPDNTVLRFKRYMGSDRVFKLGNKRFSAIELSAMILGQLKADAERALGQPMQRAIISVPAYFNAVQRQATKDAARLAGLKVERLINEPTAASLAYGLNTQEDVSKAIVLDLGGGTFDVSLVEIFDGVIEVHASAGDALLGGEDFTDLLARDLCKRLDETWDESAPTRKQYFFEMAERFKTRLSKNAAVTLPMKLLKSTKSGDTQRDITVTTEEFEDVCAALTLRLRRPIEKCLYDSGVPRDEIDRVILVGGATRMTMLRSMAARIFRILPERSIDPDQVVALGCGVQAGLVSRNAALDDVVMTDVAPFSMGLAVHNKDNPNRLLYDPIIMRNTTLPCSRMQNYVTVSDGQTRLVIRIYQGEAPYAEDNISLGQIEMPIPAARAGEESINVRFTYDVSGLLDIDAEVVSSGAKRNLLIRGDAAGMSETDIKQKLKTLAALKSHPRESEKNRVLIARLTQLCELLLGNEREIAVEMLLTFERVLDQQDPAEIARAEQALSERADLLESSYGL